MQGIDTRTGARFVLLGMACCGVLAAGVRPAAAAKAAASILKAPSPTGRITYAFKVATLEGTSFLTWAESGKKFRQDISMSGTPPNAPAGTPPMTIQMWAFGDGQNVYSYQPMMGKQVIRTKMPKGGGAPGGPGAPPIGGIKGGKVVGKGTILGRPCEIQLVGSAKIWMWKGLALKMENAGGQGPQMSMVAKKLDMPFSAPATKFKVPAGYTVTDQVPGMGAMGAGMGAGGMGGGQPPVRKGSQ
jgi:hypothetical protein